jgi:hypothetical protein
MKNHDNQEEDYVVDQFYDLADDNIEQSPAEQWSLLAIGVFMTIVLAVIARTVLWLASLI